MALLEGWLAKNGARWVARLVILGIVAAWAAYGGYSFADAKGRAKLAEAKTDWDAERLQLATDRIEAERKLRTDWLVEHARVNALATQLADSQRTLRSETERLKQEIKDVTKQWRPQPGAALEPLPRCVFTHGFVRLYDDAIGAIVYPEAATSSGIAAATGSTDAIESLDSGLDQADVLGHHIQYGERCRAIEEQLNRLIDYELGAP